jgi:hypothetical protein
LVSKTTLGGRPWSVRLRFISDGILKLPCTPASWMSAGKSDWQTC